MAWRISKQVSLGRRPPKQRTFPCLLTHGNVGGGIVFDSDEYDEWMETLNKLGANMSCIKSAEELYHQQQQQEAAKAAAR